MAAPATLRVAMRAGVLEYCAKSELHRASAELGMLKARKKNNRAASAGPSLKQPTPLFHHNLFFRAHLYLRLTPVNLDSTNDLHLFTLKIRQTRVSRFRRVLRDPNHEGHIRIIPPKIEKRVPILTFENLSNRPLDRNVLPNMVNRFRIGNNRPRFDGACQPPNPADQSSK
jgi:hypothetical protein